MYLVILKSIKHDDERIVIASAATKESAEYYRKQWRRLLGGKHWIVDRRPGLDTLDLLGLTVVKE